MTMKGNLGNGAEDTLQPVGSLFPHPQKRQAALSTATLPRQTRLALPCPPALITWERWKDGQRMSGDAYRLWKGTLQMLRDAEGHTLATCHHSLAKPSRLFHGSTSFTGLAQPPYVEGTGRRGRPSPPESLSITRKIWRYLRVAKTPPLPVALGQG